jgi:ATP-dependent Clp endopeptidase proteolytic subunit ClpP
MVNDKKNSSGNDILDELHSYSVLPSTRELLLHSTMESEDNGIDFRVATKFIKNLRLLESDSNKPIILHLLSTGGSWNDGMAIYDAIKDSRCEFVVITHGIAASMGSLIPQAVHRKGLRITMPNCEWMVHEGFSEIYGTYRQVISSAQWDAVVRKKCYELYADVCHSTGEFFHKKSNSQVKNYIKRKLEAKEDWWLSAEDSVRFGLCDYVAGDEKVGNIQNIVSNVSRILQLQ